MKKIIILIAIVIFSSFILSGCNIEKANETASHLGGGADYKNINAIISEDYKHYSGELIEKIILSNDVIFGSDIKEITLCAPTYNMVVVFMKDKTTIIASLNNIVIYFNCEIAR